MADKDLELEIGAKDNSDGALKSVADNLAGIQEVVQDLAATLKGLDKALENNLKSMSGAAAGSREVAKAIAEVTQAAGQSDYIKNINKEFDELGVSVNGAVEAYRSFAKAQALGKPTGEDLFKAAGITKDDLDLIREYRKALAADPVADADKAERELAAVREHLKQKTLETLNAEHDLRMARKQAAIDTKQQSTFDDAALNQIAASHRRNHNERIKQENAERAIVDSAYKEELAFLDAIRASHARNAQRRKSDDFTDRGLQADAAAAAAAMDKQTKAVRQTTAAYGSFDSSLANTRYAMHDVSMTAGMMGTAILGGGR